MGRPPGAQNKDKPYRAALRRAVSENPDVLDRIVAKQIASALNGDSTAAREIADRLDGKVPQAIGGSDELPAIAIDQIERVIVDSSANPDSAGIPVATGAGEV